MQWIRGWSAWTVAVVVLAAVVASPASAEAPDQAEVAPAAGVAAASTELGGEVSGPSDGVTGEACAANTNRVISGSLRGSNSRQVNALVGLVLIDAAGRGLGPDGCLRGGYAYHAGLNSSFPADGVPATSATAFSFTNIPANAVTFWLEVYPKAPSGQTDRTYFGGVLLRNQTIGFGRTGLNLALPATCANGGTTGSITVHGYLNGQPRGISYVYAFSWPPMNPPGGGWGAHGLQEPRPAVYELTGLMPNMGYHVLVESPGLATYQRYEVPVRPCQTTHVWASWGQTRFRDVPVSNPFYDDIEWMAENDITTGYGDGTYRPVSIVTRQAMSAFMYRLAGEPPFVAPGTPTFTDVGPSNQFYDEIEWMAAEDISTGYDDHTYRPSWQVTRGAMSAFMYRLADEPPFDAPATPSFSDVAPGFAFFAEIEWMNAEEITTGYGDGTYRAGAGVSRQAMSAFMHRLAPLL